MSKPDHVVDERRLLSFEGVPHELNDPAAEEEPCGAEEPPARGSRGEARSDPQAHGQQRRHRDAVAAVEREIEADRGQRGGEGGVKGQSLHDDRRPGEQRLDSEHDHRDSGEVRRDVAAVAVVRGILREPVDEGCHLGHLPCGHYDPSLAAHTVGGMTKPVFLLR